MKCTPIIVITPKRATFAEADGRDGVKRSPILARRTHLTLREGSKRTAAKPKPPLSVPEAVALVLAGQETVAAAARIAGADPVSIEALAWEMAKKQVHERDCGSCLACLAAGTDVHHRVRRACGPGADPVIAFGFANTALLCRPCHLKASPKENRANCLTSGQSPALASHSSRPRPQTSRSRLPPPSTPGSETADLC